MKLKFSTPLLSLSVGFLFFSSFSLVHAAPPAGYSLSWGDDFDSLSLDPTCTGSGGTWATYFCRWNVRRLNGNSDDGIKMDDTWKGANATSGDKTIQEVLTEAGWTSPSLHDVSGGTLKMRSYPIPTAYQAQFQSNGNVVASTSAASMITSEMTHYQQYGYWETRLKLNQPPTNKHFSFWLLAKDGVWPPEIDMLETVIDVAHVENGIVSSLASHGSPADKFLTFSPAGGMLGVWHTYGFEWTATTLNWYVDGVLTWTQPNYIFKPMYVLAEWENGGNWEGNTDANTPWPGEMEVDYVRVYSYASSSGLATSPTPSDMAQGVATTTLSWVGDSGATTHGVYLGTSKDRWRLIY
jgi:hypothetical protein